VRTKTPRQADKILDAAGRLFGTQRFHEVRMDDIAAEAAVGKATLYRYFSDKDELYLALLVRSADQFTRRVRAEAERAGGARARLVAVVAAILAFFDERPHLLDLILRAELLRPSGVADPWQQSRDELFRLIHDLLEAGKEGGEFAIRDADLAMLLLLGGLRAVIRFGKHPHPRNLASRIVNASAS
jgi:TetR/AcrR family transcriptional repressor of mexJK operon